MYRVCEVSNTNGNGDITNDGNISSNDKNVGGTFKNLNGPTKAVKDERCHLVTLLATLLDVVGPLVL